MKTGPQCPAVAHCCLQAPMLVRRPAGPAPAAACASSWPPAYRGRRRGQETVSPYGARPAPAALPKGMLAATRGAGYANGYGPRHPREGILVLARRGVRLLLRLDGLTP